MVFKRLKKACIYKNRDFLYSLAGGFPEKNGKKQMTREDFAEFLGKLKETKEKGQDIDAFVKKFEHRNVYFYNDGCIKKILASEKNLMLTTDLVNAALGLMGADRIANPKLVNPFIPGELGYRSVEPDILLTNDRGKMPQETAFQSKFSTKTIIPCSRTVLSFMWHD